MALLIQKYGGTSVGTPERIRAVADRVARDHAAGNRLVVVVSAMGHSTDELIELAEKVSSAPPAREMDMLLTAGERISMSLLSMALWDRRVPAISFTGSQSGIITDGVHGRARIRRILGGRIREALAHGKVAIVAGFQGVSESKEITTLGRGGSDTTAVALAAALGADRCEIYTDVDGVFSADPRTVPEARLLSRIPYDVMAELATRGAGVLHPRSVELARAFKVSLRVRNSFGGESIEGELMKETEVTEAGMEDCRIRAVTCDRGKILVSADLARPAGAMALWDRAASLHASVVAPVFLADRVEFFSEREAEPDWRRELEKLCNDGFVKSYRLDDRWVPVSVVGDRFSQDGAALHRVMETLTRHHIAVGMGGASAHAMTFAIMATHVDDAIRVLHAEVCTAAGLDERPAT